MINGVEYTYEDIQVEIFGRVLEGVEAVKYGATKNHYNIHGRGNKPVAMGKGKKDSTPGSLTIHQSEFEALQAATPRGKDPTDWAPFDITVAYAPEGGEITVDVVPNCRVSRWEKGMTTEEGHMTIDLELATGIPRLQV
jgi:hypothetical protein